MTSTVASLTEAEVREMSTAELRVNLERCIRLVGYPSLLQQLPDGGEGIRHRHSLFTEELRRRENESNYAAATSSSSCSTASAQAQRKRDNEAVKLAEAAVPTADAAREIGEKYKDMRVSVDATVRRMYDGALSETELQRIIQSVPPGYFLTYAETCAMEKNLAKEARKEELRKLAEESARRSLSPS
ncbi:hypothetical protein N2W54_005353 [Lotmaria passim]